MICTVTLMNRNEPSWKSDRDWGSFVEDNFVWNIIEGGSCQLSEPYWRFVYRQSDVYKSSTPSLHLTSELKTK